MVPAARSRVRRVTDGRGPLMCAGEGRRALLLALTTVLALTGAAATASGAAAKTTWLCRPGLSQDPCRVSLATTRISPIGANLGATTPTAVRRPKIDCFYVYPTVSDQQTAQASLRIDPEQRSIALYQAARYSQECRVFAPMYRQLTISAIQRPIDAQAAAVRSAYADVRAAWRDYLAHDNHGRGVVLIGHSQGSAHLTQLIRQEVDPKPSVRRRLLSAILLGGNVLVPKGKDVGGSFRHVPACRSNTQLGCVVAFSTFATDPPADALYGRAGGRFTTVFGGPSGPRYQVLCTNPARLRGGSAPLDPIYPTAPFAPGTLIALAMGLLQAPVPAAPTPWIEAPGSYIGQCSAATGAHVLRITAQGTTPTPKPSPTPEWGLHLLDANIALGDLVDLVHSQARAWDQRPRSTRASAR
ncbi:MAG: hypothetical protein QOH43_1733 [Solirubrobacteraceae bacterium]|jgi:hypothetical protein|nr:hypothetical protein [Solirubrobacteraceae bacterium]